MPLPRWIARFNRHVTNRLLGPLAPYLPAFGVVVHVGRKSHRVYRTPVNVFRRPVPAFLRPMGALGHVSDFLYLDTGGAAVPSAPTVSA